MKVYAVRTQNDAPIYYATKFEAMTFARQERRNPETEGDVEVEEVTLVPVTKAVVVRLINVSGGYVEASRVIATLAPKGGRS